MSPSPVVPDLSGLTAQVKRVADALYAEVKNEFNPNAVAVNKSIAELAVTANEAVASVIGTDPAGDHRVRTDPDVPA